MTRNQNITTQTFKEIWNNMNLLDHSAFYKKAEGLRESTIRCYATGHRAAHGPSLACLVRTLKRMGYNVGDGRFLFPESIK